MLLIKTLPKREENDCEVDRSKVLLQETFNFMDVLMLRTQNRREVLVINLFNVYLLLNKLHLQCLPCCQ